MINFKKEVSSYIKDKLNSDEKFKEYYSKLPEDRKADIKENLAKEREIVHNFNNLNKLNKESLKRYAEEKFKEILVKRGYKKLTGAKARAFSEGKLFVSQKDGYFIGLMIFYEKKFCNYFVQYLLEVPTSLGKVYVHVSGSELHRDNVLYAFTAHFFDRYKERMGYEGSRDDIIKRYLKDQRETQGAAGKIEGDDYTMYLKNGLALGESIGRIMLIKTFVSDDQTRKKQEDLKEDLKSRCIPIQDEL
jgi:hypothetical protein